ncbi:hypothetical protein M8J77_022574 [Diaphorina citri]|nr:hypothetical protein M8J77_022574 [Diaphorina citri]
MEFIPYAPRTIKLVELLIFIAAQGGGVGFGIRREVFFLNLEDGYFGCQVNQSTEVLQLYELSRLCDGTPDCYLGSDELRKELKCTRRTRNQHDQGLMEPSPQCMTDSNQTMPFLYTITGPLNLQPLQQQQQE